MCAGNLLPVGIVTVPGVFAEARRRAGKKQKNISIHVAEMEKYSNCNCKSGARLAL